MQTPRGTETPDWVSGSSFYDYFSVFNGHRISHYLATPWFDDFPADGHLGCLWLFTFMNKYWCPEYPWIPIPAHLSNLFPQQTVSDGRLRLCNAHCYSVLQKVSFCQFPSVLPWDDRFFSPLSSLKRLARRCSFNHCVSADAWCISLGKHSDRWDWAWVSSPLGGLICLPVSSMQSEPLISPSSASGGSWNGEGARGVPSWDWWNSGPHSECY